MRRIPQDDEVLPWHPKITERGGISLSLSLWEMLSDLYLDKSRLSE